MKRTLALLLLVSSFVVASSAQAIFIDRFYFQWKQNQLASHAEALKTLPFVATYFAVPGESRTLAEGKFDQKLDHTNSADTTTFKQRYWVDSSAASGADAPVIYFLCGESRCSPADGFALALAKELGAHAVTLEHRFYGDSIPTKSYSANDLKLLSTDQALEDFAEFQKYAQKEWKLTGKWIVIGGSYPGSLSAYYRLKHPELAIGSLASSAPVEAKASFEEYDYQVATVIPSVCLDTIHNVVTKVETMLAKDESRAAVKKLFGSSEIKDDVDFLYVVADMAAGAIQYGKRAKFCGDITSADDAVAAYAKFGLDLFDGWGMKPIEDTPQGNMSENPADYTNNGMRQWLFQSCTEYGYYQVAYHDPKLSSRSPRVNLDWHNGMCDRLYGIKTQVDTDQINKKFYAPLVSGEGSKILFTNGSDDPWQHLSINPKRGNVASSVDAVFVDGGSHCSDLGNSKRDEVVKVQNLFRAMTKTWLAKEKPPTPPKKPTSTWPLL